MAEGWGHVPPDEAEILRDTFGVLLSQKRCERGWTATELARRSGVSADHIGRLQRGRRRPRPAVIESLARALAPDDAENVAAALEHAAGDSLRPDTVPGGKRRARAERRALLALPTELAKMEKLQHKLERSLEQRAAREAVAAALAPDSPRADTPTMLDVEPWPLGPDASDAQILAEMGRRERIVRAQQAEWDRLQYAAEQALMQRGSRPVPGDHHVTNYPVSSGNDD